MALIERDIDTIIPASADRSEGWGVGGRGLFYVMIFVYFRVTIDAQ